MVQYNSSFAIKPLLLPKLTTTLTKIEQSLSTSGISFLLTSKDNRILHPTVYVLP